MKKKILITGSSGFIGSNLLSSLNKKYQVLTVSRFNGQNNSYTGDLEDFNFVNRICKNVKVIVHLAYSKNYMSNITITKNLIQAARENKVQQIILVSSMSAKRNYPDDYGKNKKEIELLIKDSKLNYTILRPSIVYGKGSKSFEFIINYIKKIPFFTPIIGNGKYKIYPVKVDDVVYAINKCIDNKRTLNKEYDLPGKDGIYFIDLINCLKKGINVSKKNINIPIWFCKIISIFFPKILNKNNIKNLTEDSLADITNAAKDFKYSPISFNKGIENGLI
ncbi:MAG TPA: NAD-dependent epimerase/dehydratase family protein [Candidatus Paceibacterota bacterium]|nr:NAD-dependent epimerase/dehydratase family protein [Candidatus Paceibacterota bacterium]